MRKEYNKALRAAFDAHMVETFPEFVLTKVQSRFALPSERCYCRSVGERLRLWITLIPSVKAEEFTVEVGWSRLGRFPELPARPATLGPSAERREFAADEYFTRLASLWSKHDPWWVIERVDMNDIMGSIMRSASPVSADAARQMVAAAAQDAINKLRLYGVPYLEEFRNAAG